ncbi:Delta-latroinsectotoxin-Lt1a [Pseudocercospora fuligena]|uniref:Delta-latroinsectotoxin-Lt1a n=1 Tax=Pseudocercospora fuligena TaxID=685502 RepID=A0A8H6RJ77_9PEZI|nr:Delta-latroinsectotoxin-Lt1a [Pseudocercospora fuligena]
MSVLLMREGKADVNFRVDPPDSTALHECIAGGNVNLLYMLLRNPEIDANAISAVGHHRPGHDGSCCLDMPLSYGLTPLIHAISYGNAHLADELLRSPGVDVNAREGTIDGHPPLGKAIMLRQHTIVEMLLKHPFVNKNATFRGGRTALIAAVEQGMLSVIKNLVGDEGVDVNCCWRCVHGRTTPLLEAISRGRVDVVECLLARPDLKVDVEHVEFAMRCGQIDVLVPVLERAAFEHDGIATMLGAAICWFRSDIMQVLLDKAATVSTEHLEWAIRRRSKDTVQLLLEKGEDNIKAEHLELAILWRSKDTVELLLEKAADKVKAEHLELAILWRPDDIVQLLLEKAQHKARAEHLELAIKWRSKNIVQLLLETHLGLILADVNDPWRRSTINRALRRGMTDIMETVLNSGKDFCIAHELELAMKQRINAGPCYKIMKQYGRSRGVKEPWLEKFLKGPIRRRFYELDQDPEF